MEQPEAEYQPLSSRCFTPFKRKLTNSSVSNLLNVVKAITGQPPEAHIYHTEWKLNGKCDMAYVTFNSIMPRECARDECHVRMNFFLRRFEENTFHPIKIDYELK